MRTFLFIVLTNLLISLQLNAMVHERVIYSKPLQIDKMYTSMQGPYDARNVSIAEDNTRELVWVVGYRIEVLTEHSADGSKIQFMCHSNLDKIQHFGHGYSWNKSSSARLFTLAQGQDHIQFPEGFGIPMMSDEPLRLVMQALNLNHLDKPISVTHKVTIFYKKQRELKQPMVALYQSAAEVLVTTEKQPKHYNIINPSIEKHGMGCSVGVPRGRTHVDRLRNKFAGHWVVPPGVHEYHTNITRHLKLSENTTVHYIAAHVHPFAEVITLKNLTTGESVFSAKVKPTKGRVGIESIEHFSSKKGLVLNQKHEYQLYTRYNNTTKKDVDSMAVMYLYLKDHDFLAPNTLAAFR